MDPNNEVNKNIASAYLEMLALEEKKKNEGLDPVNKDAVKKNFKDRKDKDIDNDGDEDESDEYLHNRRKTVSKAIDKDGEVDQDKPKVTSSDADSEKDNDDDRDEKGSVLKKDNDKKKTEEGIIDRLLAGKPKGGSKHWVTKKPETKESVDEENLKELGLEILDKMSEAADVEHVAEVSLDKLSAYMVKSTSDAGKRGASARRMDKRINGQSMADDKIRKAMGYGSSAKVPAGKNEATEPSLLMKCIQEIHGLVEKRVGDAEQNIDTWNKQVSNRRADDVLDTEITEKEFMDMHNVDTPEFVDGPKVANKSMDAIKNSVKSKSATRNNDSTIGESVELEEASASVYKDMPKAPGKMISNRVQVKAFKDSNAMGAFLSKQNDNSWKQTGVAGLKSGKYKIDMVKKDGKPFKNFIRVDEENDSTIGESVELENVNEAFINNMIPLDEARWDSGQIPLDRQKELDRRAMVKIIRTKDNKFQVQRMTKGKFVNQGKPYNSLKQAEKERSREIRDLATGQSSMQFEENLKELGLKITDRKPIKKENDMYEGMTPMQRALAKVKAQPKDKVSVKKAPWDKDDVKKESIENVNEVVDFDNLGDSLPYFIDRRKGAESDWYSNINRTMKMLESDLKDRKNLHLGNARRYMDVKGHHEASLKAIADVRSKLKNVVKAFDKAFSEANAVDREIIRADKEAAKYKVRK
tara:strand:- start:13292 stop:15382 length:2091 start_codon:yes stop_codon:yes gene_type:complete